jgi:transcription initiation factor TFIIIB Brf1 subunit/transcription initiation factor TFIIB
MKQQNDPKIRFTRTQLTALSVWTALKQLKYPLSCNEFSQKIQPLIGNVNLMKTEKRACHFTDNIPRISDIELVTAHINKLVKVLENKFVIDTYYSHILGKYAIEIVNTKPHLVKGRKSDLIAASAVFAADRLIAEYFTLRVFAEFTNVGAGNLSSFAEIFKRSAPPVPKESAVIHFIENLFRGIFW